MPGDTPRTRFQNPMKAGTAAAVAAVTVVLAAAALVFTNASTSENLIHDARVLQHTEAALGDNDVALKALTQAVLLAEDEVLGVADAATVSAALTESARTLAALETAVRTVTDLLPAARAVRVAWEGVSEAVSTVHEHIARGEIVDAGNVLSTTTKERFEGLRDTLSVARDEAATHLSDAGHITGILVGLARYVLAFLIPGVAILAYRFMARRQLRFAEVELDARLEAEEEIVRAKDEFIGNMSHELRTPLTSIFGFSELLLEQGLVDPDMTTELIGMINTESGELTRMVEDLLTSARAESDTLTYDLNPISLQAELDAAVLAVTRAGGAVEVDWHDERVIADPARFRQLIRNLLSNAHKHGGNTIRVTGRPDGDRFVMIVEDDGPGIPPEVERRLFSRFIHQGEDPLTKGSIGLGLAVVGILAAGMKGTIRYERHEGWTRLIGDLPRGGSDKSEADPEVHSREVA